MHSKQFQLFALQTGLEESNDFYSVSEKKHLIVDPCHGFYNFNFRKEK